MKNWAKYLIWAFVSGFISCTLFYIEPAGKAFSSLFAITAIVFVMIAIVILVVDSD
jgi:FtsH-binding integral membrane protein